MCVHNLEIIPRQSYRVLSLKEIENHTHTVITMHVFHVLEFVVTFVSFCQFSMRMTNVHLEKI